MSGNRPLPLSYADSVSFAVIVHYLLRTHPIVYHNSAQDRRGCRDVEIHTNMNIDTNAPYIGRMRPSLEVQPHPLFTFISLLFSESVLQFNHGRRRIHPRCAESMGHRAPRQAVQSGRIQGGLSSALQASPRRGTRQDTGRCLQPHVSISTPVSRLS